MLGGISPNVSGFEVNSDSYEMGVIDMFPCINKKYLIESTIESKFDKNYLSTNSTIYNGRIDETFIEFHIPGSDNEMIDLRSLTAEVKIRVRKADGTALAAGDHVTLVDGFFHRMFQSTSLFLNGVQCEGNSYAGLLNNLNVYTTMKSSDLNSIGLNMMYKSLQTTIPDTMTAANFTNNNTNETWIQESTRDGIHMMGSLNFDVGGSNSYLLDNVDVNIRLELAKPSVVLLTDDNEEYIYIVESCTLWCEKVIPHPTALLALNKVLTDNNDSIEYMFVRPIVKTIVFPTGQNSISIDSPFNGVIPHKLVMFLVDQSAHNGAYKRNPNYFQHNGITDVVVDVNGNCISNIKSSFPRECAQAYHQTLSALGMRDSSHLITRQNFAAGRTIFVIDTRPTETEGVINLEKTANMRITVNCDDPPTSNKILFLVGYTQGVIQINSVRRVTTNYL